MKVPDDAVIPEEKLTGYLLVPRPRDDKSKFLAQAGFDLDNPQALRDAIRRLAAEAEMVEDGTSEYGTSYQVVGSLIGPNGRALAVVTVWIHRSADGIFQFVTLKPDTSVRS
jgi:hypothetical protein